MDWTSVILALLSGTAVASFVEAIRYRKQNKELKNIEVRKADVESQREQMDLASDYLAKVKELSELNYQATLKNGSDNGHLIIVEDEDSIVNVNALKIAVPLAATVSSGVLPKLEAVLTTNAQS